MKSKATDLINILTECMDKVSRANNNKEISLIIENLLMDFTDSQSATFLLFDHEHQVLYAEKQEQRLQIPMIKPRGLLGNSFLGKNAAIYQHALSEKDYVCEIDNPLKMHIGSQMILPILKDDELVAIARMARTLDHPKGYSVNDLELLRSLTPYLLRVVDVMFRDSASRHEILPDDSYISEEIKKLEENKQEESEEDCRDLMLFFSNTVHDIRTPANSLYGFLELIGQKITDERIRSFIENAKESAKFINEMTTSLLEKAKIEHESQDTGLKSVTTIKFLSGIADGFSANMANKNIEYLIYLSPSLPKKIAVDAIKLKRVLMNLIGNAYKFTPREKQILFYVDYSPKDTRMRVSIIDSGIGIEKKRQKDIFEAFRQAEEDTSEKFGGTGLGLAICAKYVKDMGGKLELESEIDVGSEFSFEIPVEVVDDAPSQSGVVNKRKRVTILTDDIDGGDSNMIARYLNDLGFDMENIKITSKLSLDTTHLFCFQSNYTPEIASIVYNRKMELVIIEESLFSTSEDPLFNDLKIISANTYYGDVIHGTILSKKASRVLIVDDNKINIHLIEAILEDEYCEIMALESGKHLLEKLTRAHRDNHPYDIIFLDKHLPDQNGNALLRQFRDIERKYGYDPIYAISITGDPYLEESEKALYDLHVHKPFNNADVKEAFHKAAKK